VRQGFFICRLDWIGKSQKAQEGNSHENKTGKN